MEQNNQDNKTNLMDAIPWVIIGVLITLLFTLKACPGNPKEIKTDLYKEMESIKNKVDTLAGQAQTLIDGQKDLKKNQEEIQKELPAIQNNVSLLKKKLDARPTPENPENFRTLPECQEKYKTLNESYKICLDLDKSREEQLDLFSSVYDNLTCQQMLLEDAVSKLQEQGKGFTEIEKTVKSSVEKLDLSYNTGKTWRDLKHVTIGIGIGVGVSAITVAIIIILKAIKK